MDLGARHLLGLASAGLAVLVAATVLSQLGPGAANGADRDRCAAFVAESRARQHVLTGHGERVVVIGDSYSAGLGLRHPTRGWTASLPGRVQVFGFSGSGFSRGASPCGAVAFDQRVQAALRTRPDLVVVEGGLNDFDRPAAAVQAGYRRLLARIGHHRAVVIGPAPAPLRLAGARRVDSILRQETERSGTPYISMIEGRFSYLDDHLHLTAAGHRAFGKAVARALP